MTTESKARNVLGDKLQPCCFDPMTGFFVMASATPSTKIAARIRCAPS